MTEGPTFLEARIAAVKGDYAIFLHRMLKQSKHALLTRQLFGVKAHVVGSSELAATVLEAIDTGILEKPAFLAQTVGLFGNAGVFTSNGATWQQQRKQIESQLFTPTSQTPSVMQREIRNMLSQWQHNGGSKDLARDLNKLSFRVVCDGVFGSKLTQLRTDSLVDAMNENQAYWPFIGILNALRVPTSWVVPRLQKFAHAREIARKYIIDLCAEKSPTDQDMVARILKQHGFFCTSTSLAQKNAAYEEISALLIPMSSPAVPLSYAISKLAKDPELFKRIYNEIAVKSDNNSAEFPRSETLSQLVKESFSAKPALPMSVPRQATQQLRLGKQIIAKGEYVSIHLESLSPDEQIAYGVGPFLGGGHICPGRNLSSYMSHMLLAEIVKNAGDLKLIKNPAYRSTIIRSAYGGAIRYSRHAL